MNNALFYGDNLRILRDYITEESVNLIYLDPPFNSNRSYNVLFKDESGKEADAQITAFDDSWHWSESAEETYTELMAADNPAIAQLMSAMRQFVGANQMMAYLVMMTARLAELHRVLTPNGSIYLHCDPTASHYLKVILDIIFGPENFRNEIIWKRTSAHSSANRYGSVHDVILFYSKKPEFLWNQCYTPFDPEYVSTFFDQKDEDGRIYKRMDLTGAGISGGPSGSIWRGIDVTAKGRHWAYIPAQLDEFDKQGRIHWPKKEGGMPRLKQYPEDLPGIPLQDVWTDIRPMHNLSAERLGYPTQKPLTLLDRIIQASSNPGDVVLDPFSGCGTAITAAQKLGRRWIGIDITHLAIAMHKNRLKDIYGLQAGKDYQVIGEPQDLGSACQLAHDDRYQFQWWALSLVQARPQGGQAGERKGKKGADQGIDGVISFVDDSTKKLKRVLVQVKSGHVNSSHIRDLRGVLNRELDAPIGVLITLEHPSHEMEKEAISAGFYHSVTWNHNYQRIQILTIEQLLQGHTVNMPPTYGTFKAAQREKIEIEQSQARFDF